MRELAALGGVSAVLEEVLEQTGYVRELEAEDTPEAQARIENIDELMNKAVSYEQENEEPTLGGFLEEVALVADIDSLAEDQNYVVLMTLHSAKGLEFPNVYLSGMEDGLFPSYMSIVSDDADAELEEERRLCYVGITRAKEHFDHYRSENADAAGGDAVPQDFPFRQGDSRGGTLRQYLGAEAPGFLPDRGAQTEADAPQKTAGGSAGLSGPQPGTGFSGQKSGNSLSITALETGSAT